jgi:hypothetical protein
MNPVLFARSGLLARGPARDVDAACVPGTLSAFIGLALLLSVGSGCSFHAHSEWHAGRGGDSSSGGEAQPPEAREHTHDNQREGRHSSAGRDNVVRVTSGNKSVGEQGGGADGQEPGRAAVHPTGDVPPSSSDNAGGSAASSAGADSGGGSSSQPAASAPGQAPQSTPAADTSAEQTPSTSEGTLKSPSEPHVTTPTHRKPRKEHRTGDGTTTNKEGRRE